MRRITAGLPAIAVATAVAGVSGYVITWLVFRMVGAADYAVFAVFWSTTYLLVGALSGVQQEVTRGTHPRAPDDTPARPVARNFGLALAGISAAAVLAASPLWLLVIFPGDGAGLIAPLVVAAASYVLVAVLAGTLYGLSLWRPVAATIMVDGLLRLAAIGVTLLLTHDPVALAWAVAVPFPLALLIVWPFVRRSVVGQNRLDVPARTLSWNVARTVLAAASTGVLVSGFPAILKLTTPDADPALLGVVVLAVTLVRAPLIVSAMSLQSFLIVRLRPAEGLGRRVLLIVGGIVAAGAVLSVVGWLLGPELFLLLFGAQATVPAGLIAALVGSSVVVAVLFVTGPALLSRDAHFVYSVGWVAAAVATAGALVLPLDLLGKTVLALVLGPLVGVIVHVLGLVSLFRRSAGKVSMRSERLRAIPLSFLAVLMVLGATTAILGWSLWIPLLWSCAPLILLARRAWGAGEAIALAVLGLLTASLLGLVLTAALSWPIVPGFLVLSALIGATGAWGMRRFGLGPLPTARNALATVAPALGPLVWGTVLLVARVHPGSSPLSWVMNGDSANNLLFARVNLLESGIRLGPADNPVPLPAGLLTIGIAAGRDRIASHAVLAHDIAAFAALWAVVIAAVCVLVGMVTSSQIRASRPVLRIVVGALASLAPLTWYVTGYAVEYGFLNTHVALLIVLACWMAYVRLIAGRPALLLGILAVGCTLTLAVWSPLVLFPGLLVIAVVLRRRISLFRAPRGELIVAVLGVLQLLAYFGTVTLPSLLAQSSFLAAGGGAYPFSKWLFVGLGVGAVVVAAVAWRAVGRDAGLGLASMVIASGLGYAALLFAAGSTAAPMLSYYPLKFAWLAGLILFLTMIGMTAGVISTWSRRWPVGAISFVVLAAVSLAVLQFAPSNTTGYPIRNPLVRILAGDFIGSGDATARRIFRYADLTSPTLLVSSKDPEEAEIDFWVLQMQANAVAGDATLRSAAYGVYDLGKTDDLCTVLRKIDAPVTILTSDAGLRHRINQRCADPSVHVRQIAAG